MKKIVYSKVSLIMLCIAVMLQSCGSGDEKKASAYLQRARVALESARYSEAKLLIDSVKILFPKAFDARWEGIRLMQHVEIAEQNRTLAYLDSMLKVKQADAELLKGNFKFEKDAEYQHIGNYIVSSQAIEKNLHRTYLSFRVTEIGQLVMTSVYCGSAYIHHHAVRVTAPDESFAETPVANDVYETTDLGEKIEKSDFTYGQDGGVMDLIMLDANRTIKVELLGKKNYSYTLSSNDKQALSALFPLARTLSAIEKIKEEQHEATLKLEFVKRKQAEVAAQDSIK